jgi:hypothetical protein
MKTQLEFIEVASTDDIVKTNDAAYDDDITRLEKKTNTSANTENQLAIKAAVKFMQNNRPGNKTNSTSDVQ